MREKTLRYPGHAELMRVFSETGFFRTDTVDVAGTPIRPLDLTQRLLFPHWQQTPDEEEFTILRVVVDGRKGASAVRYSYELFDTTDHQTHTTSMARTTAFPCAIVARMLASGTLSSSGVIAPETLAANAEHFEHIMRELSQRGVNGNLTVAEL